jgi:hypothetical protein
MLNILNSFSNAPFDFILQIIVFCLILNLIFSIVYYILYKIDETNLSSIITNNTSDRKLEFIDIYFFSTCIFFGSGSGIFSTTILCRSIVSIHIILSYLITGIIIGKVIEFPIKKLIN